MSLDSLPLQLPALQPVATRLQSLELLRCRLQGSAGGFLTAGWTALTSLSLIGSDVEDDVLTPLSLPALEVLSIYGFRHRGRVLRPDQLCCPLLCCLDLLLDSNLAQGSEGSRQCCSLLSLARLTTLTMYQIPHPAEVDLPASLTRLIMQDSEAHTIAVLEWMLLQAAKCIRGGAQLRSLTCACCMSSSEDVVEWGPSSNAHYRELGEQLSGLTDLRVVGTGPLFLSAIGAVASAAPSLTRLTYIHTDHVPNDTALPPICSASLKCITVRHRLLHRSVPHPQAILTFLSGCSQLRDLRVQFCNRPNEGASVKIRCHCNSQRCIVPFEGRAEKLIDELSWPLLPLLGGQEEVGVRFIPMPASPQAVQPYTVLFTCHMAGREQAPKWGHIVMAGLL